ncbi:MAG: hypothetical protein ABIK92_10070 [Pseudomonadota bacterium]
MVNGIINNLPLVLAQKPDISVMQRNLGSEISLQSHSDTVILEKRILQPAVNFAEKGSLIDIYA